MSWLLQSTLGKAVVFYVDLICGLLAKSFLYADGEEDE